MHRVPTWAVAAVSLVVGFGVADATGVRPLGGLVLLAGVAWCFVRWRALAGTPAAMSLAALYAGAFAISHALADALGAWGAVFTVAAVVGAASWALVDGRRPATARAAGG